MRLFYDAIMRDERVLRLIERVREFEIVQGVVVTLDPLWRVAWCFERSGAKPYNGRMDFERNIIYNISRGRGADSVLQLLLRVIGDRFEPSCFTYPGYDFDWRHSDYDHMLEPFLVQVVLRPTRIEEARQRRVVEDAVREADVHAIVVDRARAKLFVSGGDKIEDAGSGCFGTLGGFVKDQYGTVFGVTCKHVVQDDALVCDVHGNTIGRCKYYAQPRGSTVGSICSPRPGSGANELDVALLEMLCPPAAGRIKGWTSEFGVGQVVTMDGATTGLNRYEVGGLAVFYKFLDSDGIEYCFKNLFEVRPDVGGGILPVRLSQALSPIPRPGDSGAWIEAAGAYGQEWCGMLVGADSYFGYALQSEAIINWFSGHPHNLKLAVC